MLVVHLNIWMLLMPESLNGSLNAFTAGDVVIECVC